MRPVGLDLFDSAHHYHFGKGPILSKYPRDFAYAHFMNHRRVLLQAIHLAIPPFHLAETFHPRPLPRCKGAALAQPQNCAVTLLVLLVQDRVRRLRRHILQ